MTQQNMPPTMVDDPTDQTRVIEVLRAAKQPRSSAEIADQDPALGHNRLQLLVALDELVSSGQVAKRFDPAAKVWRYLLPRARPVPSSVVSGGATR